MKRFFLSAIFLLFCFFKTLAQGEVPVDMYTGTPNIEVPLTTVVDHGLSQSVKLVYNARGIRVGESPGVVGLGWTLTGGGSITRDVRGLPDDYYGIGSDLRRGWCYSGGGASLVNNMVNSADTLATTCTDELANYNTLNSLNWIVDTEPDIFHFSMDGYSGDFVLDKDLVVRLIPFQDLRIIPVLPTGTTYKISGFTITTNDGNIYNFDMPLMVNQWTKKLTNAPTVEILKRDFELYDTVRNQSKVSYVAEWQLSKVASLTGAYISFDYKVDSFDSKDTVKVSIRSSAFNVSPIYLTRITGAKKTAIKSINSSSGVSVDFSYDLDGSLRKISLNDHRSTSLVPYKEFNLFYQFKLLTSVAEDAGCDKIPPYTFTYVDGIKALPTSFSKSVDFWGYSNGKVNTSLIPKLYIYPDLPASERYRIYPIASYAGSLITLSGADRTPDLNAAKVGCLETISYPAGGSTNIKYELNSYYDEIAQQTYSGGGLRIKSLTYYDGVNSATKIYKEFSYDETSGKSSGRLISRPIFASPASEYRDPTNATNILTYQNLVGGSAQDLWDYLTIRTENDLSGGELTHGSTVGYKFVKVLRPGSGYATFEYTIPGAYGAVVNGTWNATRNKFSRSSSCPSMGIVKTGGAWTFPYNVNNLYDYERGLIWRKREYNEQNVKVRETLSTYQYLYKTGIPVNVYGLRYEKYPNSINTIFFFSRYNLPTEVGIVPLTENTTVYDETSTSKYLTSTIEYLYESTFHRLLTHTRTTNSDGTVYHSRIRYPLDYGVIPTGSDKPSTTLGLLQTNFQNGIVVEQISTFQKPLDVEKVTSASLVIFDKYSKAYALPQTSLSLNLKSPRPFSATPVTGSFTPSFVNGITKKIVYDSAYEVSQTIQAYDAYNNVLTATDQSQVNSATHWGYQKSLPVVTAKYVRHDQFAYSDFETTTGFEFQPSTVVTGTGRNGGTGLYPQVLLSRTIQKTTTQNYILSFWFKKLSAAVDFTLKLKDPANLSLALSSSTFTVSPAGSDYEYFQQVIPVSALTLPASFVVELQGQLTGTMPTSGLNLLPMLDDVSFYPEYAELTSFTYSIPFGVNSVTNSRGLTQYTSYDKLGRVRYILDQDKNIVQRNTYSFSSIPTPVLSAAISVPSTLYTFSNLTFQVNGNECMENATYEWDFGSGYQSTGTSSSITRILTVGNYVLKVRITDPWYGQVISTKSFIVSNKPLSVDLCIKGIIQYNNCTGTVTQSGSCEFITETPKVLYSIFRAMPQRDFAYGDDDSVTYSYVWYTKAPGAAEWGVESSTDVQFSKALSPNSSLSYQVKCHVTRSDGRQGDSSVYTVVVTQCN